MVRKSELQDAIWDEVNFENAVWTIPKDRMKRSKAHNVYLSRQTLDIMIALKTCAGNSRYLLSSRYDADAPMSELCWILGDGIEIKRRTFLGSRLRFVAEFTPRTIFGN